MRAERQQVIAFRLAGHHLARRLPPGWLREACGPCGVQDSPPGSAALALAARVDGLTPDDVTRALGTDKTLLQVRGMRAAPYLFPASDAAVFTTGLLPVDEKELRFFILGASPGLDRVAISATKLTERTASALLELLDGRVLTFRQLSSELTERISRELSPQQREAWALPGGYDAGQSLGEALVHFALYPIALQGLYCYVPREGNEASFARVDQWLGRPLAQVDQDSARAELVRRYLRCYGPSDQEQFSRWAGIAPSAARRAWRLVEDHLAPADWQGGKGWLHEADLAAFHAPPSAGGVRLLPPHDPYLQQRDRETLVPERALHRQLWRRVGDPGVVLAAGEVVAIWRPRKKGSRLVVSVEPFVPLAKGVKEGIAAEAGLMSPFRDCTAAETIFAG